MTSTARELLDENGVITLEIGFQTLPKSFFEFYVRRDETTERMRDSRQSYDIVRNKILRLLKRMNILEVPMYVRTYILYYFDRKDALFKHDVVKVLKKISGLFASKDPPFMITELVVPKFPIIHSHFNQGWNEERLGFLGEEHTIFLSIKGGDLHD